MVGKGGTGKTVLAALLTRALSERGLMVLAVDLDLSPGFAVALGLPPEDNPLPDAAVQPRADTPYGWGLASHLSAAEAVRRYAAPVSDKVVFLGFGNLANVPAPLTRYLTAVRQVAETFDEPGWAVVVDLAAGPSNPFEGYARFSSLALVVVEPTPTSVVTARRLLSILEHDGTPSAVVVMRTRPGGDRAAVEALQPLAEVPFDEEVRSRSRHGPVFDIPEDSPALEAVRVLVAKIAS